jgi:hypothetical protein
MHFPKRAVLFNLPDWFEVGPRASPSRVDSCHVTSLSLFDGAVQRPDEYDTWFDEHTELRQRFEASVKS